MHRGHEKDQKDKDRAKAEVARLNGVVSSAPSSSETPSTTAGSSGTKTAGAYTKEPVKKTYATEAQRKAQLQQLVDMGIAIPDEFRGEMAMAGDWHVTEERIVEDENERKPDAVALGVRKRTAVEEDEEEQEVKKRRWGSSYKSHPGEGDDLDLDALLSNATNKGKDVKKEEPILKQEEKVEGQPDMQEPLEETKDISSESAVTQSIKVEATEAVSGIEEEVKPAIGVDDMADPAGGVVFKKRKAKNIRQK